MVKTILLMGLLAYANAPLSTGRVIGSKSPAPGRTLCTWDITFARLGRWYRGQSANAWYFTDSEVKDMFGDFVEKPEYVLTGSWYECGSKRVNWLNAGVRPQEGIKPK